MKENKGYTQKDITETHREYYESRRKSKKENSQKEIKAKIKEAKGCYMWVSMREEMGDGMYVKVTKSEMTRLLGKCFLVDCSSELNSHFSLRENGDFIYESV